MVVKTFYLSKGRSKRRASRGKRRGKRKGKILLIVNTDIFGLYRPYAITS